MNAKKNVAYSLLIVLLTLCCLYVGKLVLLPDQVANAQMGGGAYQVDCAGSNGLSQCVVINASTGDVVNVFATHYGKDQSIEWCYWYDEVRTCNQNKQY